MSDNSKQFETTSAPSTSKRAPTRPLGQFPVPNTESCGSKKPKSSTARRVEAERDRPRNLFPTSHKTHAAKFTPDLDDPRDILGRSTEYNTAPSPFTFPVSYTSCCVNSTAAAANGTQTLHIEYKQHRDFESTLEYQPAPLGDQQELLEPLADDATTFLHPPQPQTIAGLPVASPVHRGHVAPSQSPAISETSNNSSRAKDRRHIELHDRILAVSGASTIGVKHEVDSRSSMPRNHARVMERAPVILRTSNYHGPTPWNYSQDPLPFRAHSPVHPLLIPNYDALEEISCNLRPEELLPTSKRVGSAEISLISNESGADSPHSPPSSRSSQLPEAERPRLSRLQRGNEFATHENNSGEHGPTHRTFQTSDTRAIDSPVPNLLKSPRSENTPSSTALTTPNGSRRREQIPLPRQDTAAPENAASIPPETKFVTRQNAPSLRASSAERASMSTGPSPSVPHTKKPASSAGSSSSIEVSTEVRQPKKQSRTSATSPSHMDFYGLSAFDWDVPYLPSSIPTSLLLNNQYQHSVTVSPHQLHTPHTHHHYHHHQHVSPFSLHHQQASSILYPTSPPAPPTYPTSIPPHLTTVNHARIAHPAHTPSIPFPNPEPPPSYVPLAPIQHGGKEKPQFAPRFLHTVPGNPLLVDHGSGGGGDRKGKGKVVDRGTSTASTSTTGKKRKRESSAAEDECVDVKQRRTGKGRVDGEEDEGHGKEEESPSSPQDKKKTGRKRNNKIDIACNHCRSRKLKCDGARPICTNCSRRPPSPRSSPPECKFDPFPRRRGPAKHKQLKLDAESESSWPLLRAVPRTRARAAAEAKILIQPLRVGARRSASPGGSESSSAGGSVAHPSATPILFGGEVAILATLAASSTRESSPAADEEENKQIDEPCASKEKREEEEEKHEEEERPRVEDGEKREEKPKEEKGPVMDKSPKKEEKKEVRIKMDGDEGKVDMLKEATLESSPPYYLLGHHTTLDPSTSTHKEFIGGPVATTMSTKRSPSAVAAGLSHIGFAQVHEEEQGGGSEEDPENSDDDYDSQGEESE